MPKKAAKSSKTKGKRTSTKAEKYDPRYILCHPSTWIAAVLALALLVIYGISTYGFEHISPKSDLDIAKLAVFDDLLEENLQNLQVNSEKPSVNEVTGYGISDEDGVFYVTFDYATYSTGEDQMPQFDDLKHGIMYFWPDTERSTYSHAFSYHDDDYRPSGTYVELGDRALRTQLAPSSP